MTNVIGHAKTNAIPDFTQADLNAQIALGNFPIGTTLSQITLPSDWNHDHVVNVPLLQAELGIIPPTGAANSITHMNAAGTNLEQSGALVSADGMTLGIYDGANDDYSQFQTGDGTVTLSKNDNTNPVDFIASGAMISKGSGYSFSTPVSVNGVFVVTDIASGLNSWVQAVDGNIGYIGLSFGVDLFGEMAYLVSTNNPITGDPQASLNVSSNANVGSLAINDINLMPVYIGQPRITGGPSDDGKLITDGDIAISSQNSAVPGGEAHYYNNGDYNYYFAIAGAGSGLSGFPGPNDPMDFCFNKDNDHSNTSNNYHSGIKIRSNGSVARTVLNDTTNSYDDGSTIFQVNGAIRFNGTASQAGFAAGSIGYLQAQAASPTADIWRTTNSSSAPSYRVTKGANVMAGRFALTDASSVAIDCEQGQQFSLLATSGVGNTRTLAATTNTPVARATSVELQIVYTQDATGSRDLQFATGTNGYSGNMMRPNPTAGSITYYNFKYDSGASRWVLTSNYWGALNQIIGVPTTLFVAGADSILTASGAATSIIPATNQTGLQTLPANSLYGNKTIAVELRGVISTAAVPGTLTIAALIGSTTMATVTISNLATSQTTRNFRVYFEINCRTPGASGTGVATINGEVYFPATGTFVMDAADLSNSGSTITTGFDTTVANLMDVKATFSASGNTIKITNATMKALN